MVQARDQMSDAVDAPRSSITSGATVHGQYSSSGEVKARPPIEGLTPIWSSVDFEILVLERSQIERDAKVSQLDVTMLCRKQVGSWSANASVSQLDIRSERPILTLEITVHDVLRM